LGILERNGKVYAIPVKNRKAKTIVAIMVDTVESGATVYTDEFRVYIFYKETITTISFVTMQINTLLEVFKLTESKNFGVC